MKKRAVSIMLCLMLILGTVPALGISAQAAGYKLFFNANTTATVDNMPPTMTGANTYEIPAYYYSEEDGAVHNGVPTRYKYTFLGWSENKSASDPDYVPGNTIILSQNTTLYAVWKFGIKSAQTLTTNGSCVITTDFPGQEQWVKIRLEDSANYWSETGTSQIWSAAEGDPIAELYDANGDFLDWNDNTSLGYNDRNFRIPYSFSKSTTYYLSVTTDYFSSVYDDTMEAYMPETVIVNLDKVQNRYNARFYDTFADEGSGSLWRTIALFDGYIGIVPSYGYNEEQSMYIDNFLGWGTNSGDVLFPGDELYPKSQTLTTVLEEWEEVPTGVVCGTIAMLSFGRQICWYSFTPLTSGTYHALLWEGDNSLKCSIWEGDEKKFSDTYSNYDSDTGLNDYSVYLRSGKTYYFGVRPNVYFEGVADMEYVFEICRTATLSYNANGGSGGPSSQSGAYEYTIPSTKPTRSGYTFTGWSTTPNNEDDFLYEPGNIVEVNAAATLYAQWSKNANHTVTYNYSYNGGSSSTKTSASVAENAAIDLTPTATKSGWTFVGWNTDPNATSKMTSLKMGTSNVTLYAIFKKTITGTFIDYSGTTKKTTIKTVDIYNKATSGYLVAPTQNTYTGWTARGWTTSTSANASYTSSFSVSSDTTYYQSKKVGEEIESVTETVQETVSEVTEAMPENTDYSTVVEEETTPITVEAETTTTTTTTITTNTTITTTKPLVTTTKQPETTKPVSSAKPAKGTYTLSLSGDNGVADVQGAGTYHVGDTVTVSATPLIGYTFRQWTSSDSSILSNGATQTYKFAMPAGNISLKAITYIKPQVTVTAGTGVSSVSGGGTYAIGQSVTITAVMKEGYDFAGWSSSTEGFGSNQLSYTFTMPEQSVSLKASGTAKTFTLSVKSGTGISGVSGSGQYKVGDKVTVNATVQNNYVFSNWSGTGVSGATKSSYTFTMPGKDVTLTANAKEAPKYTLTVAKGENGITYNVVVPDFSLQSLIYKGLR